MAQPSPVARADCGQVLQVTSPASSSAKPVAVFSSPTGISAYDIGADAVAVVEESPTHGASRPQFRTRRLLSFVVKREEPDTDHTFGQDSLYELDLETGTSTELLRFPNAVHAYAWNPDGTLLAYQLRAESVPDELPISLCLFDSGTGAVRLLRQLSYWAGRETNQRDEVSIAWSPTATSILVIDTIEQPSVYVVGVDGQERTQPRDGSFGRWLSDDTVLVWDDPQAAGDPGRWLTFSVTTSATDVFGLPPTAHRPALSLDGAMIAFDDGAGAEPSVWVYDVKTGSSRRLGQRLLAPIWLGPGRIAATEAGPCPPDNFCVVPWEPLGRTVAIDVLTGDRQALHLPTTMQDIFSYGSIDTSLDVLAP